MTPWKPKELPTAVIRDHVPAGSPGRPVHRVQLVELQLWHWHYPRFRKVSPHMLTKGFLNMQSYLDSAQAASERPVSEKAAFDHDFHQAHPALHEYLTALENGKGKPRQVSTLVLFSEDGNFKATLIERNHDVQLWVTGSTILGILEELETALTSSEPGWRRPTQARKVRRS